MISICTVSLNEIEPFLDMFLKSIELKTKLVTEVIIAKMDETIASCKQYSMGNIKVIRLGVPLKHRTQQGVEHALGIHACIDKSTNDYILLSDPDIIYYNSVESIYLDLMNKYDLNIIGASHHSAVLMAYSFFPWLGNCLIKKSTLPNEDFLRGDLKDHEENCDGKFLIPNAIEKYVQEFPNPTGHFDTGSNLYLWNKFKNGKWLSFQTPDCHNYSTNFCRGSIKLKMEKMKLFYHLVGVTNDRPEFLEQFEDAFDEVENG